MSRIIVLVLALACGLVASLTIMRILRPPETPKELEQVSITPVPKVRTDIPAGTVVKAEQIYTAQIAPDTIPEGAILSEKDALGSVAKTTIYSGEFLMRDRLSKPGSPAGLSALIPEGFRAITLRVDDTTSVAGFIRPGHHVDVLTTIDTRGTGRESISKVILQNVKVVATGQELEETEEEQGDKNKTKLVPTVTVIVTLEQAERLALADYAGDIRLVLRSHTDLAEEKTPGVTLSGLIPQADRDVEESELAPVVSPAAPEPTPQPTPQLITIPVYRGSVMTETTFKVNRERNSFEPYQSTTELANARKEKTESVSEAPTRRPTVAVSE